MNTKSVCITSRLLSGKKKHEYQEPLAKAGYELVDSLKADVNYLVVSNIDDKLSSKTKNAIKWGVKMIGVVLMQCIIILMELHLNHRKML